MAVYTVLGGVPAYLERFDAQQSLSANIRQHLFQRLGMFRSEPSVLISDLGGEKGATKDPAGRPETSVCSSPGQPQHIRRRPIQMAVNTPPSIISINWGTGNLWMALASLALVFEVVSASAGTGAIGATAADVLPASAVESGRAFPLQQEVVR